MLPKFRELTRAQCVGVILLDPTAHAHGRLFMSALGAEELPVQRVTFDSAMIATVREAPEGLTIARIEETRHAFLVSMRDVGAEFFWLWPVVDEERLSALLVVGYHGEPSRDPAVADYGAAFAERLRAALSKSRVTNGSTARRTTIRSPSFRTARCFATGSRRNWPPQPPD